VTLWPACWQICKHHEKARDRLESHVSDIVFLRREQTELVICFRNIALARSTRPPLTPSAPRNRRDRNRLYREGSSGHANLVSVVVRPTTRLRVCRSST